MRLTPSRRRHVVLALLSAALLATGIWMISEGQGRGWPVAIFFGLCLVVFVVNLLPGAAYLELRQDGFTFRSLRRSTSYEWRDVDSFHEWRNPASIQRLVGMDLAPHVEATTPAGGLFLKVNRKVGAEALLPDTYGLKASELAQVMQAWRDRYGTP